MTTRGIVAAVVLAGWGAGIAIYVRREADRPIAERLATSAMRLVPGVTWLTAERDGRHVGYESITIDTLPHELRVTQFLVIDTVARDTTVQRTERTTVQLSRGLVLRSVRRMSTLGADTTIVVGTARSDTLIDLRIAGPGRSDSWSVHMSRPLMPAPLIPIVVALTTPLRPSASVRVDAFELTRDAPRSFAVRVTGESTFVIPDSAVSDSTGAHWHAVHTDSVRAFHLSSAENGLDQWVDDLGQPLLVNDGHGLVLTRTAFELAFRTWHEARIARRADPGKATRSVPAQPGRDPPHRP